MADPQKPAEPAPEKPADEITKPDVTPAPAPDAEKDDLKKKVAKYEFNEKLGEVSKTYPHAAEFSDDIEKLMTDKGYSIEDASLVVLNKNGKLITAEQIAREKNRGGSNGIGGSMDTPPPRDKKDPTPGDPGSAEFYANRFKELEAKGEIRIV